MAFLAQNGEGTVQERSEKKIGHDERTVTVTVLERRITVFNTLTLEVVSDRIMMSDCSKNRKFVIFSFDLPKNVEKLKKIIPHI